MIDTKLSESAQMPNSEEERIDEEMNVSGRELGESSLSNKTADESAKSFSGHYEEELGMRSVSVPLWKGNYMHFNPLTSVLGFFTIAALAVWCAVAPESSGEALSDISSRINENWVWFNVGTKPLFLFFVAYLSLSKYGSIKFGKDDEEPEFSDGAYFAMLFSAGVAVGMFFYGVSEPLIHLEGNRFAEAGYHNDNEKAQQAITLTLFHWGFTAWSSYVIVACAAGLSCWRYGLPLTMRSCFYPLLGVHTWSWVGDVLDAFTIVTVISGVCTSLGLGAIQLVTGLQRIGWIDQDKVGEELNTAQCVTIAIVTVVATASVVSGLDAGVKFLSQVALITGLVLWALVFFLDDTTFLLDLIVQSTGQYFQWTIFQTNFLTDAFDRLPEGGGSAVDGNGADKSWMASWTLFYWSWFASWSSFVGLFIARISRGRTLRNVVGFSLIAPLMYVTVWFSVFGGVGIRQQRVARELMVLGNVTTGNEGEYLVTGSTNCYMPPEEDVYNGSELLFSNPTPGLGPFCTLDNDDWDSAWFNVLYSFYDLGAVLSAFSLVAIAIYFVTSSDSGSLIVDTLASNGRTEHHWLQRVLWAFLEGTLAITLVLAGGRSALSALQAASIIAGLPFTFLLCFCTKSIWLFVRDPTVTDVKALCGKGFHMPFFGGIFDAVEYAVSMGSIHPSLLEGGIENPSRATYSTFLISLVCPFITYYKVLQAVDGKKKHSKSHMVKAGVFAAMWLGWIILFALSGRYDQSGLVAFGALAYFAQGFMLAATRNTIRARFNISGGSITDVLASLALYPQVLTQLLAEMEASDEVESGCTAY